MSIRPGELLIDDSNWRKHVDAPVIDGVQMRKGHLPRDYATHPHGSLAFAPTLSIPLIPRSEWSARIKEREGRKMLLTDIRKAKPFPSLDQDGTNYCWANGVFSAVLFARAYANLPYVALSPASVAAPINNFQNEGGWGLWALKYMAENGFNTADEWPPNAINRKYYTEENKAKAKQRRVTEWFDLRPNNFDEKMTCLLLGMMVPSGYPWWSHEVCGIDPVEIEENHFGSREINSWGDRYGDRGEFVLSESKATADDQFALRVVSAF